jgi:hypothetical protein
VAGELPRLTLGERLLVYWLEERLRFVGAETFVLRFGGPVVMRVLKADGIVGWVELPQGGGGRWVVNRGLRNAAGFLRWAVGQRVRPGR